MDKKKIGLIKELKTVLNCEQFVLTGSTALVELGFDVKSDDLDIILVKPTKESQDILAKYSENYKADKEVLNYGDSELGYMFKKDGVKVDIFVASKRVDCVEGSLVDIAKVSHIVKAKKDIGRAKDFMQLMKLSRSIMHPSEFNKYIDNY